MRLLPNFNCRQCPKGKQMTKEFHSWMTKQSYNLIPKTNFPTQGYIGFFMEYIDQHSAWETLEQSYAAEIWHKYKTLVTARNTYKFLTEIIDELDGYKTPIKDALLKHPKKQ